MRIVEKQARKLRANTVRVQVTGTVNGKPETRRFRGKREGKRGRIIVRMNVAGFSGPDVIIAKIQGRQQGTGKLLKGVRIYLVCKDRTGVNQNFGDRLALL
jgi:hypothetical protein